MTEKDRAALKEKTKMVEVAAAELEAAGLVDEKPSNNQTQEIEKKEVVVEVEEQKEEMNTAESLREPTK